MSGDHTHIIDPGPRYFIADLDNLTPYVIYRRITKTVSIPRGGGATREVQVLRKAGVTFSDLDAAAEYVNLMNGKDI